MGETDETQEYVHQELNQEVTAISGYYYLMEEINLPFQGRKVLCLLGCAVLDNSCCSCAGSFGYALVPGFIMKWKYKNGKDGLPVSLVEPIRGKAVQDELIHLIKEKEAVNQVNFI